MQRTVMSADDVESVESVESVENVKSVESVESVKSVESGVLCLDLGSFSYYSARKYKLLSK